MDLIQVKRSTDEKTIFAFNYTKILGLDASAIVYTS